MHTREMQHFHLDAPGILFAIGRVIIYKEKILLAPATLTRRLLRVHLSIKVN